MSHKSFAAALAETKGEPITFDFGEDATFSIPRPLPGFPMAELAAAGDKEGAEAIAAFMRFFESVMAPEEFRRFKVVCTQKRVPLELLVEIGGFVLSEGTGRPTQQQSDSVELSSSSSHLFPVAAQSAG